MKNRLADSSSPYLRMHADNPVAWQPWDDTALAHAREQDLPILLSIGYSACHWCHVMAHECFEDAAIAAAMNAGFVNIKLDREQRPDIDQVYQLAHQAFSGRGGGWPLTVFLDPANLSPFYIGTYFPPTPRHGLPGFPEVLQQLRQHFTAHRKDLPQQAEALAEWLQQLDRHGEGKVASANASNQQALEHVRSQFDPTWGGSQGAPKFPRAGELQWLLDQADGDDARAMAQRTLDNMASRGLQDHLGGGFFRYCVDADWTIPHFEKMLYDNAQLLPLYARLTSMPGMELHLRQRARQAATGIVDWLANEMTAADGSFYSALGADSEGREGAFYLWSRKQFETALPEAVRETATLAFGLEQPPNFEGQAWHLLRVFPLNSIAMQFAQPLDAVRAEYASAQRALLDKRASRERPLRDDKVLTAWNALAISGLARSARCLRDDRSHDMARKALAALRQSVWIDGELFANVAEPAERIPGFLDDHAFLLDALLETLQLEFQPTNLDWAVALADTLCERFEDRDAGGFRFSTPAHHTPLARTRSWADESLPNGNAVAIHSLLRLGHLIGENRYLGSAERALEAASGMLQTHPAACPTLLRALQEFEQPRTQIVIRCAPAQQAEWQAALDKAPGPGARSIGIDRFIIPADAEHLPGILAERQAASDTGTAWICSGLTCQAPIITPDALKEAKLV